MPSPPTDAPSLASSMQIWHYKRECQLGDYVYADGSWSDKVNKAKTSVGICFYIDPNDKTHRLCIGMVNLTANVWGLSPTDWPQGIELLSNKEYNVFDVPSLLNKTKSEFNMHTITDAYRDEIDGDKDGFYIPTPDSAFYELGWAINDCAYKEYKKGDLLPWGKINSIKLIVHRNIILSDSNVSLPIPQSNETKSEMDNLLELMLDVVNSNGSQSKYKEYYFPAVSECVAYQPGVLPGETLADSFKVGQWFLPSAGELARIGWWQAHNIKQEPVLDGVFSNAVAEGLFTQIKEGQYFWGSTEMSQYSAWINQMPYFLGRTNYVYKGESCNIRPICAF